MVKRPRLLLADEPTASLTQRLPVKCWPWCAQRGDSGVTVLIASHDKALTEIADRVLQIQEYARRLTRGASLDGTGQVTIR